MYGSRGLVIPPMYARHVVSECWDSALKLCMGNPRDPSSTSTLLSPKGYFGSKGVPAIFKYERKTQAHKFTTRRLNEFLQQRSSM